MLQLTVMTVLTKTKPVAGPRNGAAARMQVKVHVDTEVMDPELARRRANVWLLETVGN